MSGQPPAPRDPIAREQSGYTVAFASFAPLNTELFLADAGGSNSRALVPNADLDYNASFSRDGRWIVFTSHRAGSADIFRVHPDGSGLERLTGDPSFDDQASLSPDGKFLAFVSSRSGQADIWILDLTTRNLRNLTNQPGGDYRPSWSPDGQWIAFSSVRGAEAPLRRIPAAPYDIYVVRPDGSGERRVTNTGYAGSPSWLPDGTGLLYYQTTRSDVAAITAPARLSGGTTQIVSVDLKTNGRRELTSGPGRKWSPRWVAPGRTAYVAGGPGGGIEFLVGPPGARGDFRSPDWSSDGRHMVFHRETDTQWPPHRPWFSRDPDFPLIRTGIFPSSSPSGDWMVLNSETAGILHNSIVMMSRDGSQRSTLYSNPKASALAPVWSPAGDRIAFGLGTYFQGVFGQSAGPVEKRAGADIAVVGRDGNGFRALTQGGNRGFPSWSPDGKRLVYRALGETGKGLIILNVETGEERVLTTGPHNDNFPAWSPAGDRIAFASDRDGADFEIYTIQTDGTGLRRLTNSPGHDGHLSWSQDGRWIAFASNRAGFRDEAALHAYNAQPGDIFVMRADGSGVRMLTDDQFEEATPAFIPNRRAQPEGSRSSPAPAGRPPKK